MKKKVYLGKNQRFSFRAFTLIELLVVLAVIGLLSSLILVNLKQSRQKAKTTNLLVSESQIYHTLGFEALALWDFNEGSGSQVKDKSGNGNDGTLWGTYLWENDTPSGEGYALYFDNPGCVDVNLMNGSLGSYTYNDFTITAWYKSNHDSVIDDEYIFHHYKGTSLDVIIFGPTDDAGHVDQFRFHRRIGSTNLQIVYSESDIVDKQWHFLVASRGGGRVKIYVDSVLEKDESDTLIGGIKPGTYRLSLGCDRPQTLIDERVFGTIDELRVYGEDIDLSQIKKLYVEGAIKRGLVIE